MPHLQSGEIELYYEVHGAGPPLLLIAGLASDSQSWGPVLPELAARYRVIVPDNRGCGRTRPRESGVSITAMADDCMALVRHLGLEKVSLLGHSMGGFVAQECAVRFPGMVDRLILAATSSRNSARNNLLFSDWASALEGGSAPEPWFRNIFYWIFSQGFFEDTGTVTAAARCAVEYPYPQSAAAFRGQVEALAVFDGRRALSRIGAKTLVIGGGEDLLFPARECLALAQAIPGASLTMIDGAGHSIHMENPRAFVTAVVDFLNLNP